MSTVLHIKALKYLQQKNAKKKQNKTNTIQHTRKIDFDTILQC